MQRIRLGVVRDSCKANIPPTLPQEPNNMQMYLHDRIQMLICLKRQREENKVRPTALLPTT